MSKSQIREALESAGNGSKLAIGIWRAVVAPLLVLGIAAIVAIAWRSSGQIGAMTAQFENINKSMNAFIEAQEGRDMRQDLRMNGLEGRINFIERAGRSR